MGDIKFELLVELRALRRQVSALRKVAERVVEAHQVEEIYEEFIDGPNLSERPTGEWICLGCGRRNDDAIFEHEADCLLIEARAALGVTLEG